MVLESGRTTIISCEPCAKAPSIVCGTWISWRPLVGADEETVQRVDHRIAALRVFLIAGRKEDDHVAIDGLAFKIALKRSAVDLDVLHRDGLCTWHRRGNVGLYLCRNAILRRRGSLPLLLREVSL